MKNCCRCKVEKTEDSFYTIIRRGKTVLEGACKKCKSNRYFSKKVIIDILDIEGEIWCSIPDFSRYLISNKGRLKAISRYYFSPSLQRFVTSTAIIMTNVIGNAGYIKFLLVNDKGKRVNKTLHQLTAQAFISNPNGYNCVNHINGIKVDNRIENLEWTTSKENSSHYHTGPTRRKKMSSEFTGVHWIERDKRWVATISLGKKGQKKCLGYYLHEKEAALAYKKEFVETGCINKYAVLI